ncbi:MAG: protein kinase [Bryobacteraceae bacterium]|nr:protein kinase [Bryobacteraceae bacterium]
MNHRTVGHYEILGQLGAGGMGVVHLARDSRLNRKVALKLLPSELAASPEARQRFTREAQSASALNSPNIVTIYEIGTDGDADFIAMEYIQGETLAEVLRRGVPDIDTMLAYAIQTASALAAAHREGIVHRDVKPGNVMVNQDGLIKVLDFGLAKPAQAGDEGSNQAVTATTPLTQLGVAIGTLSYMSPEQALGEIVDARSDVFSFGTVLYEMFTGQAPFSGPTPATTFRRLQLEDPPKPSALRPALPSQLDSIILKALAKRREDRYPSAIELESDLRLLQSGSKVNSAAWQAAVDAPGDSVSGLLEKLKTRTALRWGLGAMAAVALAVWQPWAASPHQPTPSAQRWFDQGTSALRDGTYHTASLALERAVESDPKFALAHIRLAETYFELDAPDRAKEELLRAVPSGSRSALSKLEELHLQAVRLTLTADFAGAEQQYASIRDTVPSEQRPSALVDYGRALEKAENINGAIAAYEQAARSSAQYPAAFLRLGILHRRRLDQVRAGAAFQRAEGLYRSLGNMEGLAEVNYQRGVMLGNLGNARESKAVLDTALEVARTAGHPQQEIAILLQLSGLMHRTQGPVTARDYASQAIELARAKGLEPLAARGLIDLGNSYFASGDPVEAENYFREALATARRNKSRRTEARALLSLGSLDIQNRRFSQGQKNIEQALAFYRQGGYRKETSQALLLSGRARRSLGDYEGAYAAFEEQHRRSLEVGDVEQMALSLEAMGLVRQLQGRLPEALARFREALSAGGSGSVMSAAYYRMNCASALWTLGHYEEAERLLKQVEQGMEAAKANKAVSLTLALHRAGMALSQRQFAAAAGHAGRVVEESGEGSPVAAEAEVLLVEAMAHSGQAGRAVQSAVSAVQKAAAMGMPDLIAASLAAQGASLLASGKPAEALAAASEAAARNAATRNKERQWRILALAARAALAAGRRMEAAEFASQASAALAEVESSFDRQEFASYTRRADIQIEAGLLASFRRPATAVIQVKGQPK